MEFSPCLFPHRCCAPGRKRRLPPARRCPRCRRGGRSPEREGGCQDGAAQSRCSQLPPYPQFKPWEEPAFDAAANAMPEAGCEAVFRSLPPTSLSFAGKLSRSSFPSAFLGRGNPQTPPLPARRSPIPVLRCCILTRVRKEADFDAEALRGESGGGDAQTRTGSSPQKHPPSL